MRRSAVTVKICGITRPETMRAIRSWPIDHIGLLFAPSKRRVDAEQAAALTAALREGDGPRPAAVGVFVDPGLDELREAAVRAGLDIVQLHGGESAAFCAEVRDRFGVRIFKAVPVRQGGSAEEIGSALDAYRGIAEAILLDTYDPAAGGGTGRTFDWEAIPVYREWARRAGIKLIVAGGLQPDNVGELLARYRPDGVDVSSGVETDGAKDTHKIRQFIERVNQHGDA